MKNDQYDIFLKEVGKNIRRIRKKQGLTMEAVANDSEIEYRQLGRIERGEGNSTIITLQRLAEVMKVDIHQFFIFPNKNIK
ncbi:MAG: helix-turn-helix domain-containing protein [Microbacter sp.]